MTISKLASGLAIGAAALLVSVSGAFAVEAAATGSVNVRSGPGTSYGVVGVLQRGDNVDISRQSGGWCRVALSGPDGWVSCRYLVATGDDFYDDGYGRGDRYDRVRPNVSIQFGFGGGYSRPRHWDGDGHNHGGGWNGPGWNNGGWWMN